MIRGNVQQGFPESMQAELTEILVQGRGLRIERIVSKGQASPEGFWYDQAEHEFVLLVSGRAVLEFDGPQERDSRYLELGPGDWIQIGAHVRHRVHWTDPEVPSVWMAVFYAA